ncbi:MAG: restriction endonuclease, partial [Acidimicrobiia bacterium]
ISAHEFEVFVAELFESTRSSVDNLHVTVHDQVAGVDGTYEFDATIRYRLLGMDFVVLVEAKRHANPIKREHVQALHSKLQSVGAHKAVLVATSYFQSGAIAFAKTHGIALVTVTEGRFTYETKSIDHPPQLSRDQAAEHFGLPTFVGHCFSAGDDAGTTHVTLMSTEHPEYVAELLLALPSVPLS